MRKAKGIHITSFARGYRQTPLGLTGQPLTQQDRFYWELGYKEPVDSIGRIEDTAKFIAGAVTASCGLLISALKIAMSVAGERPVYMGPWWVVVGLWFVSLLMPFGVLFPLPWHARQDNPADLQATYRSIRNTKYFLLIFGKLLFFAGILAGLGTLHQSAS